MSLIISYEQLSNNLSATCQHVCEAHEPVIVEQKNGNNVVVVAEKDYLEMLENLPFLKASESVLQTIWNNSDDAEYDNL